MEQLPRVTAATVDVLDVLLGDDEPVWGLRIVKASGRPSGSVYPILERLERLGWATSRWDDDAQRSGPRRRLYDLTTDGRTAARATVAAHRARTVTSPRIAGAHP